MFQMFDMGDPSMVNAKRASTTVAPQALFVMNSPFVRDQSGAVLDRSEVTALEYNVSIPESTFTYTPPPGPTVSNFTGGTGADVKRALFAGEASPPKKP